MMEGGLEVCDCFIGLIELTGWSWWKEVNKIVLVIKMSRRFFSGLILGLIFSFTVANQVLDFTYNQYIQDAASHGYRDKTINISPERKKNQDFEFPNLCTLHDQLKISADPTNPSPYIDQDQHLEDLKRRFIELLQLSERVKHTKLNVQDLSEVVKKHIVKEQDFSQQIQSLASDEQSLKKLQMSIEEQTANLKRLLSLGGGNSNSNIASESAIQFQIQTLQIKISYLEQMERDLIRGPQENSRNENIEKYLQELKDKFEIEGRLIEEIDLVFKGQSQVRELNEKIRRAEDQIKALKLLIEDKESCEKKQEEMLIEQQTNSQIQTVIANLKAKKIKNEGMPDVYCEVSAEQLEQQIKRILVLINYSYSCAEGKSKLQEELKQQLEALTIYKVHLANWKSNDYQTLVDKYKQERTALEISIEKLRGALSIENYSHNLQDVRGLIQTARKELVEARKKKSSLPSSLKPSSGDSNQKQIKRLVGIIKTLKSSYCQQHQKYEASSRSLWSKVHSYESETRLEMKLRSLLYEEQSKLEGLERKFNEEKRSLASQIW